MKIDNEHLQKFIFWLEQHNPFTVRSIIVSLSTGVMGGKEINCYKAFEIGQEAVNSMVGKFTTEIKIRSYLVKNLESAKNEMHLYVKNKDVDASLKKLENVPHDFINNLTLIIDGNYLVHHAVKLWPHGTKYYDICELYFKYIQHKFKQQFDSNELY